MKRIGGCGAEVLRVRVVLRVCEDPRVLDRIAIHLLKAGVDFATISQWLGHASLNTTMQYARADLDLKRQALAQVFPEVLAPPKGGAYLFRGDDITGWLRRL